jgi:hypothetical protein
MYDSSPDMNIMLHQLYGNTGETARVLWALRTLNTAEGYLLPYNDL